MSRREFHFVSGGSSKFWAINDHGTSFEVTFGKIGTAGTTQTKSFENAADAKKAYDKLVQEKTSKGYVEVGSADKKSPSPKSSPGQSEPLNELYFSTTKTTEDMENLSTFIGRKVVDYKDAKSIKKGNTHLYRIRTDWEDPVNYLDRLNEFLDNDVALTVPGLILGNWNADGTAPGAPIIKGLADRKDRLPMLQALFFGDIAQEECEVSWIDNGDMSPLLAAFPKLELLRIRGSNHLAFSKPAHANLRALGIETGGLPREVVSQLSKAKFPNLEYLELWLGTEQYGGTTRVTDLQPILKNTVFPKLKYLGLRNSEIVDEIAGVIISSPIIEQIEVLDLSLGTLTDEGAKALMKLPKTGSLKRLDLHRHFLSNAMIKQLKTLPFTLNVAQQETPEDWGDGEMRFVAVGE